MGVDPVSVLYDYEEGCLFADGVNKIKKGLLDRGARRCRLRGRHM
jgi:hypothetical protein